MDLKVFLAAVLVTCAAQTTGLPVFRDEAYDQEHGMYAVSRFTAEATVFRMRAYTLALEMSHTIKYIDQQILAKLGELQVDPQKIEDLEKEMQTRGSKISDTIMNIMTNTQTLIDHLNTINNNIVNDPTTLTSDKLKMEIYLDTVDTYFELGQENVILSIELIKTKILILIAGKEDPIVDEINVLLAQAETVLTTEQDKINASKLVMDTAGTEASASLDALIQSQTAPPY